MKKILFTLFFTLLAMTILGNNVANLSMQNGDSLQARLYTADINLLTDFGEIVINVQNIGKITFLSDDRGRTALYTTLEGEVFYGTILNDSFEIEVFGSKTKISKDVLKEIKLGNKPAEFRDIKLKIETKTNDIFYADIVSPSIKIKTSYGIFEIPVENIKNIKFEGTSQSVTNIELEDGNSIKGIIDNPTLALCFAFGNEININTSKIMSMNMRDFSKTLSSNGGVWTLGAEMPTARQKLLSVSYDGKILAMGGYNTNNRDIFEIYDIPKNEWTSLGNLVYDGGERYSTKAKIINGIVFILGGYYEDYGSRTWRTCTLINPNEMKAVWATNIPTQRGNNTVETFNGELYVIGGGWSDNPHETNKTEIFNPQKSSWRNGKPMPTARTYISSVLCNDMIYVFGGFAYSGYLDTVEMYDPKKDEWCKLPPMPTSRSGTVSAEVNGKIYVIGGRSSMGYLKTVEIYDAKTKKWTVGEPLLIATAYATCEVVDGKIYVIGGENDNYILNTVQIYQP